MENSSRDRPKSRSFRYIVAISSIGVAAAIVAFFVSASNFSNQPATASVATLPEVGSDQWFAEIDTREGTLFSRALADPEVSALSTGAHNVNHDFTPVEFSESKYDEVVVHVVGEKKVEGDWQTGYTVTFSGLTDIVIGYDGTTAVSRQIVSLPDEKAVVKFTDSQKAAIQTALDDERVQGLMQGRDGIYVSSAYESTYFSESSGIDCPANGCAAVLFGKAGSRDVLSADVNTLSQEVVKIYYTGEW